MIDTVCLCVLSEMLLPSTKPLERSASWADPSPEPETMMPWELRYLELSVSDYFFFKSTHKRAVLVMATPASARYPCRHSSCSVQRESCRRGKRWSTRCPSTRLTSSTAARRASWLCSPETPERSSRKSGSRSMPKCVNGGKKARLRSSPG